MADVRDEHGNPIQLTDELGNPVQLTDEHGNPMHLKGVATTDTVAFSAYDSGVNTSTGIGATHGGVTTTGADTGATHGGDTVAEVMKVPEHDQDKQQAAGEKGHELGRSSSPSSSSSEDDGQGGRRKKSLKQKIKEKLTGGKHKEDHPQAAEAVGSHGVTYTASTATTITTTTTGGEHHEKKSMMEKIKEKLPGHHNH